MDASSSAAGRGCVSEVGPRLAQERGRQTLDASTLLSLKVEARAVFNAVAKESESSGGSGERVSRAELSRALRLDARVLSRLRLGGGGSGGGALSGSGPSRGDAASQTTLGFAEIDAFFRAVQGEDSNGSISWDEFWVLLRTHRFRAGEAAAATVVLTDSADTAAAAPAAAEVDDAVDDEDNVFALSRQRSRSRSDSKSKAAKKSKTKKKKQKKKKKARVPVAGDEGKDGGIALPRPPVERVARVEQDDDDGDDAKARAEGTARARAYVESLRLSARTKAKGEEAAPAKKETNAAAAATTTTAPKKKKKSKKTTKKKKKERVDVKAAAAGQGKDDRLDLKAERDRRREREEESAARVRAAAEEEEDDDEDDEEEEEQQQDDAEPPKRWRLSSSELPDASLNDDDNDTADAATASTNSNQRKRKKKKKQKQRSTRSQEHDFLSFAEEEEAAAEAAAVQALAAAAGAAAVALPTPAQHPQAPVPLSMPPSSFLGEVGFGSPVLTSFAPGLGYGDVLPWPHPPAAGEQERNDGEDGEDDDAQTAGLKLALGRMYPYATATERLRLKREDEEFVLGKRVANGGLWEPIVSWRRGRGAWRRADR